MKHEEAVAVVRKFLKECPGIWVQGPHPQIIEAVRALLEGFEAASNTLEAICAHCGFQAGSRACIEAECPICEWRGPEPGASGTKEDGR